MIKHLNSKWRLLIGVIGLALVGQTINYLTQIMNLPTLDPRTYDFATKHPGGSLTASVAATVTLTPCPKGLNGADANHYLYISGGTGTAEAVLLTGGTCISNAASGTVIFTPANGHTGAWGVNSATDGWFEAVNDLPTNGGRLTIAPGTYRWNQSMIVGNGSASGQSTRNGAKFIGVSAGVGPSEFTLTGGTAVGSVIIEWAGPTGGTMLKLNGPYAGFEMEGLTFNCYGGTAGQLAATAFESNHNIRGSVQAYKTMNCTSYSVKEYAYPSPTGVFIGSNTKWDRIFIEASTQGGAAASGFQIGGALYGASPHLDVAQSQYERVMVQCTQGGTGIGVNFRFADVLDWYSPITLYCATPMKVTPPSGATQFPQSILQYGAVHIASNAADPILVVDTSWTAPNGMTLTNMHTGDGEKIPVHAAVKGNDDQGRIFGFPKFYGEYAEDGKAGVWAYNPSSSGANNAVFSWILTSDTTGATYQAIANRAGAQWQFNVSGLSTASFYVPKTTGELAVGIGLIPPTYTVAQLASYAPPSGTIVNCSDCAPASTPCTGSSSGHIAYRKAAGWHCN